MFGFELENRGCLLNSRSKDIFGNFDHCGFVILHLKPPLTVNIFQRYFKRI